MTKRQAAWQVAAKDFLPVWYLSAWSAHQTLLGVPTKIRLVSAPKIGWCRHQVLVHGDRNKRSRRTPGRCCICLTNVSNLSMIFFRCI